MIQNIFFRSKKKYKTWLFTVLHQILMGMLRSVGNIPPGTEIKQTETVTEFTKNYQLMTINLHNARLMWKMAGLRTAVIP